MFVLDLVATMGGMITFLFDGVIIATFIVAAKIGCHRSYKQSLASLLVQLTSLIGAVLIGRLFTPKLTHWTLARLNFSLLIPSEFALFMTPLLESILTGIIFIFNSLILFALFKSILSVFARHYNLAGMLFTNHRISKILDTILSIVLSVLNGYTYLLVAILIFAFPFFNIVREGTLSNKMLKITPFASNLVAHMYEPFFTVQEIIRLFNSEFSLFLNKETADLKDLAQPLFENPEMIAQFISLLPEAVVIQIDDVLAENGLTRAEVIEMIKQGELSPQELELLFEAYLPS